MKLDNSIAAVVTGAASGLGEATARMLAGQGVKVAIFDMQKERGEAVAKDIGGVFCEVDVTNEASVEAALAKARAAHGVERILVNCAGIAPAKRTISKKRDTGELLAHDLGTFQKTVMVNLVGTFNMIAKSALGMAGLEPFNADGGRGVIVNTASVAGEDGQIGQAAYAASKGGVASMTLPAARELAAHGIRVVAIAPGVFETPMMAGMPQGVQDALGATVPFPPRLGKPFEFAALAQHICENVMLNGEVIRLDGALRMGAK